MIMDIWVRLAMPGAPAMTTNTQQTCTNSDNAATSAQTGFPLGQEPAVTAATVTMSRQTSGCMT